MAARNRWVPLLVLALGCPQQSNAPPPQFCQPLVRARGAFPFHDPLLGAPVTVPVGLAFDPCAGGKQSVDARAVVADSSNAPVPFTLEVVDGTGMDPGLLTQSSSGPSSTPGQIVVANVTFTPRVSGPHHLSVSFESLSQVVQVDVEPMIDRRPAVFHQLSVPVECMELVLSNDAAVCLSGAHTVAVVVDGGVTDQIDAYSFDVDAQRVWALVSGDGGSAVQLFELSAAGKLTPLAALDPLIDPTLSTELPGGMMVTASGDTALVTSAQGIAELSFDAGIVEGPTLQVFATSPYALQWVPGLGVEIGVATLQLDGFCTVRFDLGAIQSCGESGVRYSDGRSVWLQKLTPGQNVASATTLRPDAGLSVSSSLVFSGSGRLFEQPLRVRATGPFIRDQTGIEIAALAPDAVLEFYGAPPGDDFVHDPPQWAGSTATRYWEWHPSGRLIYFDR